MYILKKNPIYYNGIKQCYSERIAMVRVTDLARMPCRGQTEAPPPLSPVRLADWRFCILAITGSVHVNRTFNLVKLCVLRQRVRSRGLEEVVILNVDSNTLESPFDDIKRIPSDVV